MQKARKHQGDCEYCRVPIVAGASYKWVKSRFGPKRVRHGTCPTWRPSELTGGKIATAYAAQEDAYDAIDDASTVEEIIQALEDCAGGARACMEDYQEGLDNMPENLQDGDVGMQIQERIDALEYWATDLEGQSGIETWDGNEGEEPSEDWLEGQRQNARDLVDSLEL